MFLTNSPHPVVIYMEMQTDEMPSAIQAFCNISKLLPYTSIHIERVVPPRDGKTCYTLPQAIHAAFCQLFNKVTVSAFKIQSQTTIVIFNEIPVNATCEITSQRPPGGPERRDTDCSTVRLPGSIATPSGIPSETHDSVSTPRLDAHHPSRSHAYRRYRTMINQPATKTTTLSIMNPA
jgi:hypothetical protein